MKKPINPCTMLCEDDIIRSGICCYNCNDKIQYEKEIDKYNKWLKENKESRKNRENIPMKRILKEEYIFTADDMKMLSHVIPVSPCITCSANGTLECCGCVDKDDYDAFIQPYKDADIYEFAATIRLILDLRKQRDDINKRIKESFDLLPEQIQKLIEET